MQIAQFKLSALGVLIILIAMACRFGAPLPTTPTPPTARATSAPSATSGEPVLNQQACPVGQPDTSFPPPANPQPGPDGVGDNYFPELGNRGYDVQHYQINLAVDLDRETIDGCTTIEAKATQGLSIMHLEFLGLVIDALSVDGAAAEYERSGIELIVTLPQPVANGQPFSVLVEYHGSPGEGVDLSELPEYSIGWGWYGDGSGAYVAAEPTGSSSWYPNNEHPLDKATYGYRITVLKPFVVAANGTLDEEIDNGETVTYVWNSHFPMASYLTTVGIAEFELGTDTGPNGLPIRNFFEKDIPRGVRDDFDRIGEIIDFYDDIFGTYPFEAAGVVVHDLDFSFSLETQTMIVFGEGFTDEYVVAHELAHMWFGDSVGLTRWQDIWLNEGFATYASTLWNEHAYGASALDEAVRGDYQTVAEFEQYSPQEFPPPGDPGPKALFSTSVYLRGALTLHALRLKVGDDAFFDILRTYYARFAGGNATTGDFITVAEEVSGQQLDDLFDAWLYQEHIPDIPQMDLYRDDFGS